MSLDFLIVLLFSFLFSNIFLFILVPFLRRRLLDYPNLRSSHSLPTPRGGGISFVFVSVAASFLALLVFKSNLSASVYIPLFALPLSVVGLLDDRFNLPVGLRFVVQFATSFLLLIVSPLNLHFLLVPLGVVFITAIINFTNFMDGLDGLVVGCMSICFLTILLSINLPWPLWALVGSLLSFNFWNWSPAKVFMGDVGSTFVGAVFAGMVLQAPSWSEAIGFVLVATPLLADAFFCVLRRFFAGQHIFQAHRLHLFQRLYQAGWSHARVSLTYIFSTVLLSLSKFLGGFLLVVISSFVVILFGIWLDKRFAVPFTLASNQ